MQSDDEIRKRIVDEYGPQLASCETLLVLAHKSMGDWTGRPAKRGADRIILAEGARATKTFDGSIRLCREGFGEQAAMLNRSLFEAMIVAHWTSENRREAVGLFVRHAQFTSVLWYETLDALGWLDVDTRSVRPKVGPKKRAEFERMFWKHGTRPWTTRNVPTLIREIEHLWDKPGRNQLWTTHDVVHRHNNQLLHSTSTAVSGVYLGATTSELRLTIGPSNLFVKQALLAAYWTYGQVFSLLIDVFRLKEKVEFENTFADGMKAFDTSVHDA